MFSSAFTLSQPIHNLQQQSKNNNCINCCVVVIITKFTPIACFCVNTFHISFRHQNVLRVLFLCVYIYFSTFCFFFVFGFKWIIKPLLVFENKHNPCNKLIYMTHNRSERRSSLKKTEATNKKNKKHNNTVAATMMMLLSSRSF